MTSDHHRDTEFMGAALEEAQQALSLGEVPVGAILVHEGTIMVPYGPLRVYLGTTS